MARSVRREVAGVFVAMAVGTPALAEPPGLAAVSSAPMVRPQVAVSISHEIQEVESLIQAAHFRTALALAGAARDDYDEAPATERAALEVLVATGRIALGQDALARAAMRRALDADPTLVLPWTVSPKVRALVDEARGRAVTVNP